jgi:hypothetical protein
MLSCLMGNGKPFGGMFEKLFSPVLEKKRKALESAQPGKNGSTIKGGVKTGATASKSLILGADPSLGAFKRALSGSSGGSASIPAKRPPRVIGSPAPVSAPTAPARYRRGPRGLKIRI